MSKVRKIGESDVFGFLWVILIFFALCFLKISTVCLFDGKVRERKK